VHLISKSAASRPLQGGWRRSPGAAVSSQVDIWDGSHSTAPDSSVTYADAQMRNHTAAYRLPGFARMQRWTGWRRARSRAGRGLVESGFQSLFDGRSIEHWQVAGDGRFVVVDGRLESIPSEEVGLFWCTVRTPPDFILRLRWLRWRHEDNSAVLVRFPRPLAVGQTSAAAMAARCGVVVQIDEVGTLGTAEMSRTGAIIDAPEQRLTPRRPRPAAEWNDFEIAVRGERYDVSLNGAQVTSFLNTDGDRGRPSAPSEPTFVGLRLCPGSRVAFRDIRIKRI